MLTERDFLEDNNITTEFACHSSLELLGNYIPIDTPRFPHIYTDTKTIEESRFKLIDIFRIKDYEVK